MYRNISFFVTWLSLVTAIFSVVCGDVAFADTPSPVYTANSFREICGDFNNSVTRGVPSVIGLLCTGYIQGVIDTTGRKRLCLPESISAADASVIVARSTFGNDDAIHPASMLVTHALQQHFCRPDH